MTRLVIVLAGALFFARMLVHVDTDVFFHLREGAHLFHQGRLPLVEDGSFTRAGKPMVAIEWLSSAAFYAAFALGGYPAVALLSALLLAGTLWLLDRSAERSSPELIALAALGLLNFGLAKVQNFSFLLFALFVYWAKLWQEGRRWAPWAMAGALALWVNLHGGFMLGWIMLGGVCGLELLRERRPRALLPWLLGTLACFLHPNGATGFVYPLWFVYAPPHGRGYVREWTPLGLEPSVLPYLLIAGAAIAARVDRLRTRFPWAAMAAVFLLQSLRTRKMLPYFTLSAAAALGQSWKPRRWGPAAAAACLLLIGAVAVQEQRRLGERGHVGDFEREYPRLGAEHVARALPGKRLIHPYEWGAYLLWKLDGKNPVFIDGRLDPYWTLLDEYVVLLHAAPGWRELLESHRVEAALLRPTDGLAAALAREPGWRKLGEDPWAVLYARVAKTPKI